MRQTRSPFRNIVTDGFPSLLLFVSRKVGSNRLSLSSYKFSNGVTIPAGTLFGIPVLSVHTDEELYPNAQEFDGFRFLKMREKEGGGVAASHQVVTTSAELLGFGLGRHAW